MPGVTRGMEVALLAADLKAGRAIGALNSVTVDSTGDTKDRRGDWRNGGPKTYTLTAGEEHLELSSKNLGSADVTLVAAWLTTSAGAALTSLALDSNAVFGEIWPNESYENGGKEGHDGTALMIFDALASSSVDTLSLTHRDGPQDVSKVGCRVAVG
eukprot:COSAG03_NODE_2456_length_2737_cov_23.434799_2_plen_157_part_00